MKKNRSLLKMVSWYQNIPLSSLNLSWKTWVSFWSCKLWSLRQYRGEGPSQNYYLFKLFLKQVCFQVIVLIQRRRNFYIKVQIPTRGWQFKFLLDIILGSHKMILCWLFFVQKSYGIEFSYFWYTNGSFKTLIIKIVIVTKNRYFWQDEIPNRYQILEGNRLSIGYQVF